MKRPRQKRCCKCGSCLVETQYHGQWYCNSCFRKKQLCCICGENPVEVTKGDNGYCKKCYENSVNTGFTRSVAVLAFCGSLILLLYFFWIKIRLPAIRFNCRYGGNRFFAKEIRPEIWSIDVKILKLISLEQKSFFSKVKQ